jgi:formate hydrogenlyase subunit 3/multisubunit Na+/H+ antiporter MnhD subunit
MSLLPFLILTLGGTVVALYVRDWARVAAVVGSVVLIGAVVTALLITPGESVVVGGAVVATTDYLRLFLILGSIVGLLLATVGAAGGSRRDVPAVTAAILGTSALALAVPDARLAVLAATAGGAFGAWLTIVAVGARSSATVGIRVLRATVIAGTAAVAATAWIGRDLSELAAQPIVFGLAYLAMALAVAIRFGAIPFHAWSARMTDTVPETGLPLVTAIGPAAFAIVALAWTDSSIAPLLVDLDSVRAVVLAIAVASILLASVAAWIQDDIEHIVGYSIIGDAGVVLLALAALDPDAWAPARTWILTLIVARSAFAAWASATRTERFTGRVDDLRGWALRSPVLGAAFALVVVASISLPGLAAWDARASLVSLALSGPLATIVFLGTLTPIAYYARLAVVGLERGDGAPVQRSWRPSLDPLDLTDLPGWLRRAWDANRGLSASVGALVLASLALAVSAGAFGGPQAAAGLPPAGGPAIESFSPDGPTGPGDDVGPESAPPAGPTDDLLASPDIGGTSASPASSPAEPVSPAPSASSAPSASPSAPPSVSPSPTP